MVEWKSGVQRQRQREVWYCFIRLCVKSGEKVVFCRYGVRCAEGHCEVLDCGGGDGECCSGVSLWEIIGEEVIGMFGEVEVR
jgi:hypothetical protein